MPLVIWDSLWLPYHEWRREKFALTIFVGCGANERFRRRAERDMRGGRIFWVRPVPFFEHIQPMRKRFVELRRQSVMQLVVCQ